MWKRTSRPVDNPHMFAQRWAETLVIKFYGHRNNLTRNLCLYFYVQTIANHSIFCASKSTFAVYSKINKYCGRGSVSKWWIRITLTLQLCNGHKITCSFQYQLAFAFEAVYVHLSERVLMVLIAVNSLLGILREVVFF